MSYRLQAVLLQTLGPLGKTVKETIKIDMHARLEELGLANHFLETVWPCASALREVAGKVAALEKKGVKNPFVDVELKK